MLFSYLKDVGNVNKSFLGSLLTNGSMLSILQVNTAAHAILEIFPKGFYTLFILFSIVYVATGHHYFCPVYLIMKIQKTLNYLNKQLCNISFSFFLFPS